MFEMNGVDIKGIHDLQEALKVPHDFGQFANNLRGMIIQYGEHDAFMRLGQAICGSKEAEIDPLIQFTGRVPKKFLGMDIVGGEACPRCKLPIESNEIALVTNMDCVHVKNIKME